MKITLADVNNIQDKSFSLHRENGSSDYLFVLFKSPAKVLICDEYIDANFGSFIIFDKNKIQSYHPYNNTEFVHDFMHFDSENNYEKSLISKIPKGKLMHFSLPHTISSILYEINYELNSPFIKYKKDILTNLGVIFLCRITNEVENSEITEKREHFLQLYELRSRIYRDPQINWSVDNMSQEVCLSRSYFQHLYKTFFSVSCNEDLINARIMLAKKLLVSSMLNINEIAEKCGYRNTEHFIRQFKRKAGASPKKFRNLK